MTRADHDSRRARILLVDDIEDNLLLLSATLEEPGYELDLACSGLEALRLARSTRPDLVLLDLRMPGIDGIETCRRLKADPELREVPVLFLSATDRVDDRLAGFAAGAVDFIAKPFDIDEILARVHTHLEIARLTNELSARNRELEIEIATAHAFRREHLTAMLAPLQGQSPALRRLREQIAAAAASDAPVLLRGALANGAEAVARSIHEASSRGWRPFVRVQSQVPTAGAELISTPPTLSGGPRLAEELRLADDGTIYIEGLEHLSAEDRAMVFAQIKGGRSRIIGQCEGEREGERELTGDGDGESPLAGAREWLGVDIPPVADRVEDLDAIVRWLLEAEAHKLGKPALALATDEFRRIRRSPWPGGLAELESVVRRAVLRGASDELNLSLDLANPERHLGRYRLLRMLGKGGMGEVWEARHELLPHPVAVKVIAPGLTGAALERARNKFSREAFAIARLRNPHTVQIFDFGSSDTGELYYAMELLDGYDLHSLVNRHGPLSPARAIYLMRQAASSLAEAHTHGLVHSDIKPPNLFVAQLGGEADWLKVLDFGVVTIEGGFNEEGGGGGTPGFFAPELLTGSGPSTESDIYSLGCSLYWCLCGDPPFSAPTTQSLLRAHVEQAPPSLTLRAELPGDLDELVLSCLAKRPEDRPTAAALVDRFEVLGRRHCWSREAAQDWWAKRTMPEPTTLELDLNIDTNALFDD